MAQNFSGLNRHIIGSVYCLGNKIIIDKNCNIKIPQSKITAKNGYFSGDVRVCNELKTDFIHPKTENCILIDDVKINKGDVIADTVFANIDSPGNIMSNILETNYIFERTLGHNIAVVNDTRIDGDLVITNNNAANTVACIHTLNANIIKSKTGNTIVFLDDVNVLNGNINVLNGNVCANIVNLNEIRQKTLGNPIQIQAHTMHYKGNVYVSGNLSVDGNVCAESTQANYISAKPLMNGLVQAQDKFTVMKTNANIAGNLNIAGSKLLVDNIKEFNSMNGVCIGPIGGIQTISTTFPMPGQDTIPAFVTGDAAWQSFQILNQTVKLEKITVDMFRINGFGGTSMEAKIYQGVDNLGLFLGSVTVPVYNGGDIDFSFLDLMLLPGSYTLQMDYPLNNQSTYTWVGHESLLEEPVGSVSNTTLHLRVCTRAIGGVKVTPCFTCVDNILKLEFPFGEGNVKNVEFIGANISQDTGLYKNGTLDFLVTCGANANAKVTHISFANRDDGGYIFPCGLIVGEDLCGSANLNANNIQILGNITSNKFVGDVLGNICSDTIVTGNITVNGVLCSNTDPRCVYIGQGDIGVGGIFVITGINNGTTYCFKEDITYTIDFGINIIDAQDITVDLNGHVMVASGVENVGIQFSGNTKSILIKNGILKNIECGICGFGLSHIDTCIDDIIFDNVPLGITYEPILGPLENLQVTNCKSSIENNTQINNFTGGTNIVIENCTFENGGLSFYSCNSVKVYKCNYFNKNQSTDSSILIVNSVNTCIQDINSFGGSNGVRILNGQNHIIQNLIVDDADLHGLTVESATCCKLDNVCSGNSTLSGILLQECTDCTVLNSICQNNKSFGFNLFESNDLVVKECVSQLNSADGFRVFTTIPLGGVIQDCKAMQNGGSGFTFTDSAPNSDSWKLFKNCSIQNAIDGFNVTSVGNTLTIFLSNVGLDNGGVDYTGVIQPITSVAGISANATNFWTNIMT